MIEVFFYFTSLCACGFAVMTIVSRDIFHSAVWLAVSLLSISGLYFFLGSTFLAVVQILVYVVGIMTLFIFAIKLTAKIGDRSVPQANEQQGAAFLISAAIFAVLVYGIARLPVSDPGGEYTVTDIADIGRVLMQNYVLAFEVMSVVLLVALIGAIIVARKEIQ